MPMAWVIHDWNTEPYVGGAYSNIFPTACLSLFGDALRMPVGRVHFAGGWLYRSWVALYLLDV